MDESRRKNDDASVASIATKGTSKESITVNSSVVLGPGFTARFLTICHGICFLHITSESQLCDAQLRAGCAKTSFHEKRTQIF